MCVATPGPRGAQAYCPNLTAPERVRTRNVCHDSPISAEALRVSAVRSMRSRRGRPSIGSRGASSPRP